MDKLDYGYDLGSHTRPITTRSAEAQGWFDRGLVWTYAFHHEEAIACFRRALAADPACAMAHWGVAYCIGPNYNKPWEAFEADELPAALALARASMSAASASREELTPVERALIDALPERYPDTGDPGVTELEPWNDRYAEAMRRIHKRFPGDLDVTCLYAEALMNRTPWQLWDLATGEPAAGADTLEVLAALDQTFAARPEAWSHPGLLHMYIHLQEMSPHPERALRHGDRLSDLVPDAGHLQHMATHIDVLCGDYMNVVTRNQRAIEADRKFLQREGAENFYTLYRCHNYHFKIYGAMFLGQSEAALAAAEELMETLPDAVIAPPMDDWLEGFVPMKQHALIRFGRWREILAQPLPEDPELRCVTMAMMRYARTVALSNLKDIDAAQAERLAFLAAQERVPDSRMVFNNSCRDILAVAEQMLEGELAYHRGEIEQAFVHLRRAVELDDQLPYDEPWGWMQPTRHALGALLLEQERTAEAEAVYRADLGLDSTLSRACQHPGNVWSLHGLHECLVRRGERVEAAHIRLQLDKAAARADIPIRASCYCRATA